MSYVRDNKTLLSQFFLNICGGHRNIPIKDLDTLHKDTTAGRTVTWVGAEVAKPPTFLVKVALTTRPTCWLACPYFHISKTMQYLKKYFTEGLIQMAILLSLCGMRIDVQLEPYLTPTWHEMILGPTSALTHTEFHNLRNHLENGHGLHPKNVDLDGFFTARRLLGWVHSLDRLQVGKSNVLFPYFCA